MSPWFGEIIRNKFTSFDLFPYHALQPIIWMDIFKFDVYVFKSTVQSNSLGGVRLRAGQK